MKSSNSAVFLDTESYLYIKYYKSARNTTGFEIFARYSDFIHQLLKISLLPHEAYQYNFQVCDGYQDLGVAVNNQTLRKVCVGQYNLYAIYMICFKHFEDTQ